jgi:hypothetical protein
MSPLPPPFVDLLDGSKLAGVCPIISGNSRRSCILAFFISASGSSFGGLNLRFIRSEFVDSSGVGGVVAVVVVVVVVDVVVVDIGVVVVVSGVVELAEVVVVVVASSEVVTDLSFNFNKGNSGGLGIVLMGVITCRK